MRRRLAMKWVLPRPPPKPWRVYPVYVYMYAILYMYVARPT